MKDFESNKDYQELSEEIPFYHRLDEFSLNSRSDFMNKFNELNDILYSVITDHFEKKLTDSNIKLDHTELEILSLFKDEIDYIVINLIKENYWILRWYLINFVIKNIHSNELDKKPSMKTESQQNPFTSSDNNSNVIRMKR